MQTEFESANAVFTRARAVVDRLEAELADLNHDDRTANAPAIMMSAPIRPRPVIAAELLVARAELAAVATSAERLRVAAKRQLLAQNR